MEGLGYLCKTKKCVSGEIASQWKHFPQLVKLNAFAPGHMLGRKIFKESQPISSCYNLLSPGWNWEASPSHMSPICNCPKEPQSLARAEQSACLDFWTPGNKKSKKPSLPALSHRTDIVGGLSCACHQTPTLKRPLSQTTMRYLPPYTH